MKRNDLEKIKTPDNLDDELINLEGLLKKKKWYQFKPIGKYSSDLYAWLSNSVALLYARLSDSAALLYAWIPDPVAKFFSSKSSNPRLRDFIVHGSIALLITATIITTSILTMGLGPLIMAGGTLAAAGIITAIVVASVAVAAIWGGIGAAVQGLFRYLDDNWSNVPEAKRPIPIVDNVAEQENDVPIPQTTYDIVPDALPDATKPPTSVLEILKERVKQQRDEINQLGTSNPEQSVAHTDDDADYRKPTEINLS